MSRTSSLTLDVISGRGFTQKFDHIQLHILFRRQLLRSKAILWEFDDPVFNQSFELSLPRSSHLADGGDDPTILIYISSADTASPWSQRHGKLLATALVDYRVADAYPSDFISVELLPCVDGDGIGDGLGAEGGLLFLRVSRREQTMSGAVPIMDEEEAQGTIAKRQEDLLRCQRDFIQSSRSWWTKTQLKYPFLQDRNVKLLAKDECGHFRFVGSFVNPMHSPRTLINPRFAARFVSLLPLKRDVNMTGIADEAWHCPHAFLSR